MVVTCKTGTTVNFPTTKVNDLLLPIQELLHKPVETFLQMSIEEIVKELLGIRKNLPDKDPNLSRLDSALIPLELLRRNISNEPTQQYQIISSDDNNNQSEILLCGPSVALAEEKNCELGNGKTNNIKPADSQSKIEMHEVKDPNGKRFYSFKPMSWEEFYAEHFCDQEINLNDEEEWDPEEYDTVHMVFK